MRPETLSELVFSEVFGSVTIKMTYQKYIMISEDVYKMIYRMLGETKCTYINHKIAIIFKDPGLNPIKSYWIAEYEADEKVHIELLDVTLEKVYVIGYFD